MNKAEELINKAKQAVYPRNLWHIVMIAGAGFIVLGILTTINIFNLVGAVVVMAGFVPTCLEATAQQAEERREREKQKREAEEEQEEETSE